MEQTSACSYCDAKPQKMEFFVERSIQAPILVGSHRRNRTDPMAVCKGWKTIKKNARPGWISSSLPLGTRFRIRFPSSTRWSDMLQASPWVSAHTIQTLIEPNHCPLITTLASSDKTLWGGSKTEDFIVFKIHKSRHYFGMWDGLWDDRIIAMDGEEDQLLIGTAGGSILFSKQTPLRSWREFIHPYIQAVSMQGDDLWMGGFRGLYRVRGGEFEIKRREHSVFSIAPFYFGETLIGYDGFLYNTQKDESISFSSWGNIYDVLRVDKTIWLSSDRLGVVSITDQVKTTHHADTPNTFFGIMVCGWEEKRSIYPFQRMDQSNGRCIRYPRA